MCVLQKEGQQHDNSIKIREKDPGVVSSLSGKMSESDAAGGPFQFVGPAVASLLLLLQELPLGCQPLSMHLTVWVHHSLLLVVHLLHQVGFLSPVLPLSFPNLLAEVVNAVQVWVVDQREEVSVPKLLVGTFPRRGKILGVDVARCVFIAM